MSVQYQIHTISTSSESEDNNLSANVDICGIIAASTTDVGDLRYYSAALQIVNHLKLCLATATHNYKWLEITHICWI